MGGAGMTGTLSPAEYHATIAKPKRRNKYGARKTVVDGITFDSAAEAARYEHLKLLAKIGNISNLERQVPYPLLAPNGEVIGVYICDFEYFDNVQRRKVVEDVKGVLTPMFRWKAKHFRAQYGFSISIVGGGKGEIPSKVGEQ